MFEAKMRRLKIDNRVVRVRSWEEFKRLAIEMKPNAIVYNIEQSIPARELTSLRLILPGLGVKYVFLDFPKEEKLRETGILLRRDRRGNRYIEDEDVINFVKNQLNRNLVVCSYFTI